MLEKIVVVIVFAAGCSKANRPGETHEQPRPQRAAIAATPMPTLASVDVGRATLDDKALLARETSLVAADRRAWRIHELAPELTGELHVHTAEGADVIIDGTDAILVRRDAGDIYIGWLEPGATGPLADSERPGERIEHVLGVRVHEEQAAPPAAVTVVVAGKTTRTLTPASFAQVATTTFRDKHDRELPAIALDELTGFEANGAHVDAQVPAVGAHAVLYMTRRERFKLAWLDPHGRRVGERSSEITQVTLRR